MREYIITFYRDKKGDLGVRCNGSIIGAIYKRGDKYVLMGRYSSKEFNTEQEAQDYISKHKEV